MLAPLDPRSLLAWPATGSMFHRAASRLDVPSCRFMIRVAARLVQQGQRVGGVVHEVDGVVAWLDGEAEQGRPRPAGSRTLSSVRTAICAPEGVISTRFPLPPLTVRMSPPGATTRPSSPFRWSFLADGEAAAGAAAAEHASGMPAILFPACRRRTGRRSGRVRRRSDRGPGRRSPASQRSPIRSWSVLNWIHGSPKLGIRMTSPLHRAPEDGVTLRRHRAVKDVGDEQYGLVPPGPARPCPRAR